MSLPIHEHPEEWLATALAAGLSPDERRAVDEHLAVCERCRALRADFVSLDETLLRGLPEAVGPSPGYEARLVAGFRRRHGRGDRMARLSELVSWLLRQRGIQVAGVTAALLALVGVGRLLTRDPVPAARSLASDARIIDGAIDQHAIENNMESGKRVDADDQSRLLFRSQQQSVGGRDSAPSSGGESFSARRDFTSTQRGLADSLLIDGTVQGYGMFDRSGRPYSDTILNNDAILGLEFPNTFTGSTTINAGTLPANGRVRSAAGIDNRKVGDAPFDGFITYGSPVQTVSGNAFAINTSADLTPAPASSTQNDPAPAPDSAASTPAASDVRKLIRNARAELEVASFDTAVDAITAAATGSGGFLDTRNSTRGGNGKVSGTVVVKVLPENLDRFLAGLRTLGDVKNQTIRAEDVTKDYFDTDARLRNARRMEDRLLKMLDEVKGKMSEVLQVEKELGRVRADIETMQGQLKLYDAQVRYATVTLDVHEKDLGQPMAFMLNETATLALLAADVEKTAAETRRIADAAHAQVLRSDLSRDSSGRAQATLHLLIPPESAVEVIAQVKALGRVGNFQIRDERTAENGSSSETKGADFAKVEHGPVTFDITISHDEQISRQVSFTLVAADVEGVFEKARASAVAAGGEIVNANVSHAQNGHASATLGVRVPAGAEAAWTAALKTFGRAGNVETRRVDTGPETGLGPVLVTLSVVDQEPTVQQTSLRVQTNDVEHRADEIKREAAASQVEVEASSFSSAGDGRQRAGLKFRLPMSGYPAFIERLRALGAVKDLTVQRDDRPETAGGTGDSSAPVVIDLTLYSEGSIVGADAGLGATLRRTFGQGTGALAWSIQMIGVALAFLVPWMLLLALGVWMVRFLRRRTARRQAGKTP